MLHESKKREKRQIVADSRVIIESGPKSYVWNNDSTEAKRPETGVKQTWQERLSFFRFKNALDLALERLNL